MENPDHRLTALMAAVYDTPEWQDFSHKLERLLNVRLLLIGGGKEEGPSVTGAVCYDLTVNDIAVGELVYGTDAAMPSRETIQSIGRIVQKGSALFGWFQSYFGIHPEAYLKTAPPSGDGLHCLYVKAPMSSSVPNKLCVLLQSQLHPVQHYRHRDSFSFLLQWDKQEKEEKLLLLREALRGAQLIAGLSGPFSNPALAQGCVEKAQEAALLFGADVTEPVREANGLHWKMFCARAAQSVDGNGWRIEDFLQHALKEILIYDQQNDTPYYESMYQYLLCGKNMKLAAQALEIHRNTLDYRISRIGKLFHIDFEDRHVCYEMLFSCKLYEETGKLYG